MFDPPLVNRHQRGPRQRPFQAGNVIDHVDAGHCGVQAGPVADVPDD
jgi:hypothetical protein